MKERLAAEVKELVEEGGEEVAGFDGFVALDYVVEKDGDEAVAGPEDSDGDGVADVELVHPVAEVVDAVLLIDVEAVDDEEDVAAADCFDELGGEIGWESEAVGVDYADRGGDGAAD